ncbi:cellulose binding domain-containing protein [Micromonospora sp. CPCC 206061]|uniref:cellulose binding domain-containing protein n=1 Tax=Micromonospora sp. CPCC 206061 TaxID=3122410 RepID=UPI002FF0ECA9
MRRSTFARAAAALVGCVAAITVLPTPAHAATATFTRESQWSSGYVGKMTVLNDATSTITSWRVEFDLPASTTITNHWGATLVRTGNRYAFTNLPWNGTLAANASTHFGWVASGTGTPTNCTANSGPCTGTPNPGRLDVEPPTTPANVRSTTNGSTVTISWDPSTDDTGVVAYEFWSSTGRVSSSTSTTHSMPIPPPAILTYGIRAVDAAGNASVTAPVHFGQLTDTTPPTTPTNGRVSSLHTAQGQLGVAWEASRDNVFVLGYEVTLNGRVIRSVGGTTSYVPYTGYGTYWVTVRAFDPSGNYSTPLAFGIAIDPPPPTPTPTVGG